MHFKLQSEHLKGRDHFGDLEVGGKVILKLIRNLQKIIKNQS
jgi:hypothetical protein